MRFGGKRASPCGRFDRSDRFNGARIEGAQVRRQVAAGARASAEQQIVGRLLTGRGKELSLPWSGLAEEGLSGSEDQAARLCRSDGKDGRHRALGPGSGGVMMGAGGEVLQKGCRGASAAIGEGGARTHLVASQRQNCAAGVREDEPRGRETLKRACNSSAAVAEDLGKRSCGSTGG